MNSTDRVTNAEAAANLELFKRDLLKMSERLARFQRVADLYATGQALVGNTIEGVNALCVAIDERVEILRDREGR